MIAHSETKASLLASEPHELKNVILWHMSSSCKFDGAVSTHVHGSSSRRPEKAQEVTLQFLKAPRRAIV